MPSTSHHGQAASTSSDPRNSADANPIDSAAKTPGKISSFEVKDPRSAFDAYSQQEIERLAQTDAEFDQALYQRARRLVLTRLENRLDKGRSSHAKQGVNRT